MKLIFRFVNVEFVCSMDKRQPFSVAQKR